MTNDLGKILLIGATGGTGHQAVRGLRDMGATNLLAMTRDPSKPSSAGLRNLGVDLVVGNLDDGSFENALAGVDRIYLHALSHDGGNADPAEAGRGKRLADACITHGIEHVVYNSSDGCDRNPGVPHMEAVRGVELAFLDASVPFTALRATLFMEEFWKGHNRPDILDGTFRLTHPQDMVQRFVSVRDLGRMAAMTFADPKRWIGQAIEVATDALTPVELAARFAAAQESSVSYARLPLAVFEAIPGTEELLAIIRWYENEGYTADVAATHATFPGCQDYAQFLAASNWADRSKTYDSFIESPSN
jgi:uncharacterized protein YbjT (DUF2867 family)